MKCTLVIILLLLSGSCVSQPSDFIILKKKGKTIQSFYSGTSIEFETVHGTYKNGVITQIQNDSIYLREYIVRQVMTQMGFYVLDTAGSVTHAYPVNDIYRLGKKQKGFNWSASGASLLGGGILLTLASGVVFLADRDKFSPELMAAGAGLGTIGYLLLKSSGKGIIPGKRGYKLEYINMTSR